MTGATEQWAALFEPMDIRATARASAADGAVGSPAAAVVAWSAATAATMFATSSDGGLPSSRARSAGTLASPGVSTRSTEDSSAGIQSSDRRKRPLGRRPFGHAC